MAMHAYVCIRTIVLCTGLVLVVSLHSDPHCHSHHPPPTHSHPPDPNDDQVEDARAVLQAVREKSGDKPDEVLVNIAHLFTAQVRTCVRALIILCVCVCVCVCVCGGGGMSCVWGSCVRKWMYSPPSSPPPKKNTTQPQQGQRNAAIHCYESFLRKRPPGSGGGDPGLHGKVLEYVAHAHYLDKRFEVRFVFGALCVWGGGGGGGI
jgi:hypothetical protein